MSYAEPATVKVPPRNLVVVLRLMLLLLLTCSAGYYVLKLDSPLFIRIAASENGQDRTLALRQPYEFKTDKDTKSTLSVQLRYFLWQNGMLHIETPGACITRVAVQPEGVPSPINQKLGDVPLCENVTIDFSRSLIQGNNEIFFDLTSGQQQDSAVYISPELYGAHVNSTLASLCIFLTVALVLFRLARFGGIDKTSSIIITAGFLCYAMLLHLRPDFAYSNDLPGHVQYIRYMVDNWIHPFSYDGWEHFHPPAYYFLASRVFAAFDTSVIISPMAAARFFALMMYMVFCVYGVRTLNMAADVRGTTYYLGALLIVFWPMAPIVATRVSNDIAVYAAWSVMFYHLANWFKNERLSSLQLAVVFGGVTFLFKTSGVVPLGEIAVCILYGLATRRVRFRDFFAGKSLLSFAVFILCALGNAGRAIRLWLEHANTPAYYLSPGASEVHPTSYFLTFDPIDYITHPVVLFDKEPGFLNYFLKTILHSEQQFGGLTLIPTILNILLAVLMLSTALALLLSIRRKGGEPFSLVPYIVGAVVPPVAPYIFMMIEHYMFCQSFRFIVPSLIPCMVLFMRSMVSIYAVPSYRIIYWIGVFSAAGIAVCGIVMNVWLYTHSQFG
jgi:hypothetical protein